MSEATTLPLSRRQVAMYRGGLVLFLASEGMLFVTTIAVRFVLAGTGRSDRLNQPLVALLMAVLVVSVWSARRASSTARREPARAVPWALATSALAAVVLLGFAVEWATVGLAPGSRYGEVFYLALGLDVAHVTAGLLVWLGFAVQAARGRLAAQTGFLSEGVSIFWTFVVAASLAMWFAFYVV
ncbi:MAG: hypothetical protein ACOYY2_12085 [Actinomycetota bacterium]